MLAQALMETEVSAQIWAAPYERNPERIAYRDGYRTRCWDTRVGTIELRIPRSPPAPTSQARSSPAGARSGGCTPSSSRATSRVDAQGRRPGPGARDRRHLSLGGLQDLQVPRHRGQELLARQIEAPCPYLWLDATFHKVRGAGRMVSVATVVAVGNTDQGDRTVLGVATGASEDHQFWTSFIRNLAKRGLKGVRLVISDAHEGLRQAIAKVLHEAAWQRCRVHLHAWRGWG